MARGDWVTPWTMTMTDYVGRRVTVSVEFNDDETSQRALEIVAPGMTIWREPGCLFDRVVMGREGGGRRVFRIPEGETIVTPQQLSQRGFDTITQITEAGFTVGTQEPEQVRG